jgi:hypothetical protein
MTPALMGDPLLGEEPTENEIEGVLEGAVYLKAGCGNCLDQTSDNDEI